MTLKEIYTWIEDRFPYFRQVAKPGWKVPLETHSRPGEAKLENDDVVSFAVAEFHSPQPLAARHVHPRDVFRRQDVLLDYPA